jgi:hypothetical protein
VWCVRDSRAPVISLCIASGKAGVKVSASCIDGMSDSVNDSARGSGWAS